MMALLQGDICGMRIVMCSNMPKTVHVDLCMCTRAEMLLCKALCIDMHMDMCTDVYSGMRLAMRMSMCFGMGLGTCIIMNIVMNIDMRDAYGCRCTNFHRCGHMYGHAHKIVCISVY